MKITIITAVYNCQAHIAGCIESVLGQEYPNVEYIVVDGNSSDGTSEIIERYRDRLSMYVREPDNGMYDAMNKGLARATGDIIGILNADDFYPNTQVLTLVAETFQKTHVLCSYGDIQFVSANNTHKVVRHYSAKNFKPWKFWLGYMPPHLSFFAKREVYDSYGYFKTDYRLCADFDLMVRLLYVHALPAVYIPQVMVQMRMGGRSNQSVQAVLTLNREILRACRENGIKTSILLIYLKYFTKIFELMPWNRR